MFIRVYSWLKWRCALVLVTTVALQSMAFAHRLDEYLQATLVVVEPDCIRLQINLTPGVAVVEQVLALIDRNHDGIVSTNEAAAYCESLQRDLVILLDQRTLELKPTASFFPEFSDLRTGLGIIQIEFSATLGPIGPGLHRFMLENRHLPGVSVYLVNAAQPASNSIQINKQIRNAHQSVGEIQFCYQPPPGTSKAISLVALLLIVAVATSVGIRGRAKSHLESVSPRKGRGWGG